MASGKFVAYYRVSTDKQGRSGLGLEAQRSAVAEYLNGGQWKLVGEFTEVETSTRKGRDRPQLAAALAACRIHGATLVVAKLDRLARDVPFLRSLTDGNADVVFCDLPNIPAGAMGRFMLTQMAAVAELEAGLISERTKAALAVARARGVKLGTPRNLKNEVAGRASGHATQTKMADDRADLLAPVIRDIQAGGATSLRELAADLNARGIEAPRGGAWSAAQVSRVLARMEAA